MHELGVASSSNWPLTLTAARTKPMQLLSNKPSLTYDSNHEAVIYRDEVPTWASEWLAQLYGSFYGVLPAIQALHSNSSKGLFTYVRRGQSRNTEQPDMLLMFRRSNHTVRVLNEGMQLDQTSLDTFCNYVFGMMPGVTQIDFHAVAPIAPSTTQCSVPSTPPNPTPCLSWPCTEDIVISLPESSEAYLSQLGKATRKSLKQHLSRARRALRNFDHQLIPGAFLGEDIVRRIVLLNHARMARLGRTSAINERATHELISLIRSIGEAGVIFNGTELCAGTLACRVGDDVFSLVNAHNPAFDYLGLGNVCRHLMILEAIKAGALRFHLMGGNLPAKRATLAIRQPLHHLTVYRTRLAIIRDLKGITHHAGRACRFRLHCWMEDQQASAPQSRISALISTLRKQRCRREAYQPSALTANRITATVAEENG